MFWNCAKIMQIHAKKIQRSEYLNVVALHDFASKNQVVDFALGGTIYFTNLFNVDLSDVIRTI